MQETTQPSSFQISPLALVGPTPTPTSTKVQNSHRQPDPWLWLSVHPNLGSSPSSLISLLCVWLNLPETRFSQLQNGGDTICLVGL
jgi:hypothetical protein